MISFDIDKIKDPTFFSENRLPAHSAHKFYKTEDELRANRSSFQVLLNGVWKFNYAKNFEMAPDGFELVDKDISGFDSINVPAHMQMEGYGSPTYSNIQWPWDGIEEIKPGEIPMEWNPVGSYVNFFDLPDNFDPERVFISFKGVESVVAAHPYLKTCLAVVDGEVMLRRRDEYGYQCDITVLDFEPDTSFFQSRVRPFNLFEDSLCRFDIYIHGEDVYFFRDVHHIITDGLSNAMLTSEIFRAYNGESIETETFTAFDRAIEEQKIKQSVAYSQAESYYRNLLAGLESTSYPHSTLGLGNGKAGYVSQALCKAAIEEHCSQLGVTMGNYLLTVFMEVIKRITREEKVLITTISSGREHAAMQDIQGFFVKTLPVVSADTVAEVQSQLIESISHECYPLTEMVQQMGIRPEIMYAYEGGLFEKDNAALHDELEVIPLSLDTTKVPLTLFVNPDGSDFDLSIEYDDSLYNEDDMQTLLHCIITLAQNYAKQNAESKNVAVSLQDCPILTEEEEQRLIKLGTGETLNYNKSKTFIDLFREQTKKTPDAVAVVDGFDKLTNHKCSQLTYRELDEASDEYAKTVAHGTFVCLEMPRVKEFVVAVLGIWKAGSAYVPIDTEYPEERKQFMREECDGKPLPSPDIAYMIYTSGSTGRPKGVMYPHSGMMNTLLSVRNIDRVMPGDRCAEYASFSFDISLYECFIPLLAGASCHIIPKEIRHDILALAQYFTDHDISGTSLPTQVGMMVLNSCDISEMKYFNVAGEKMFPLSHPVHSVRVVNGYGPTECQISHFHIIDTNRSYDDVPIGCSFPNIQSFVMDREMNLLPEGTAGELCIAGPQLALGYWNNPELTAERFINVTIGGKTVKIYKTGDLCRWNADGQLEYIGRIDNQVKLRGFRIELGEIENAALQIEGIRQAVAMVRNDQIVLYYTGVEHRAENLELRENSIEQELSSSLSSSLPSYMVPSAFVQLDAMPLTPNGKIDRKALPEPTFVQEEYIAPESRNEKLICKAIEDLLGIEHIGVMDSFRSCGMSSIQAMRLNMQLHKAGIHLNLSSIIKADNIRNLCQCIDEGIDNSDVGCWLNEFDSTKPTIVLCCGVIKAEIITKNLSGFSERYNIYVLQPIFNAWADIDKLSHEEIVSRYLELMNRDILRPCSGQVQTDISCIMGFSYGGELAYHLAVRWNVHTGKEPMVFMGDTVITDVKPDNRQQPTFKDELEAYYYELQNEFFSKRKRLSVPDYQGRVILISAEKESPYRIANEQKWTARNTHINIIPVNDTHQGLYETAEHYDEYLSLIENMSAQK